MIEGAIYFPVVILCVAFAVVMMVHFYSMAALSAKVHMKVRDTAGKESGTVTMDRKSAVPDNIRKNAEKRKVSTSVEKKLIRSYVTGSASAKYKGGRLTGRKEIKRVQHARSYIIKEKTLIRIMDVVV